MSKYTQEELMKVQRLMVEFVSARMQGKLITASNLAHELSKYSEDIKDHAAAYQLGISVRWYRKHYKNGGK